MNYELSIQLLLVLRILVLDQGDDVVHWLEGEDVVGSPDNDPGEILVVLRVLSHQPGDAQTEHARLSQGGHVEINKPGPVLRVPVPGRVPQHNLLHADPVLALLQLWGRVTAS